MKRNLFNAVAACVAILVVAGCFSAMAASKSDQGGSRLKVGETAPTFKLRDINGEVHRLSDWVGAGVRSGNRALVVDFFSTDCVSCKKMLPLLDEFAKRMAPSGVRVVLIAVPEKADQDGQILKNYFARNPVSFPVLSDRYEDVARAWILSRDGRADLPFMFLLDGQGKIRAAVSGGHESIDSALSPALAEVLGR